MRAPSFRRRMIAVLLGAMPIVVGVSPVAAMSSAPLSAGAPSANDPVCSSGAHTLSHFGDRVYPEMGNGGYTSLHTDLFINYDTTANLFLAGTHADLTVRATQCLTDFSFDFERTAVSGSAAGPNMAVGSVLVNGLPATFAFAQPTYPGDPNGQNDPDPAAHAVSNVNPVSLTNPNPPACSPQVSGNTQNGAQCPANKLVITPAAPIADGQTITVTINYTGRPGLHNDGDGTTEGWFRIATIGQEGSFVTTEPVGNMAWMPLNNHPSAKPTYDVIDTVPIGKTAIGPGELIGTTPGTSLSPVSPTSVNPADANFPAGSWTWHWHSPEPIASYLVENSIGSYELLARTSTISGIQYFQAQASSITATKKASNKVAMDQQEDITIFQERFNGPFPLTTDGIVVGTPAASFEEEMQGKITFAGGSIGPGLGTFAHENMHQWFGDNVSEAAFNLTFWKEGWATIGEYLLTANTAASGAGGLGTPAGNAAFDTSLINRFNGTGNYGTTSSTFWNSAPSNPTVGNLFSTASTYTRPGTAYLALHQILDSSASRPASDRWIGAMRQIQHDFGGSSITEAQLENIFHLWLPNQSAGCHTKLDQFFTQWFDTPYPGPNTPTNKPQITGPGINGPDHFYDDAGLCPRADQTITFAPLANKTYGDPDFTVSALSNSGLTVSFSASGQCTVSGSTVHLTGAGTCTITANQAGDGVFKPAAAVPQAFNIAQAGQTITFDPLPAKTYGDADFGLTATASSGLPVSYTAAGDCTVAGSTVSITAAGSCTITASQAGNADYTPAADKMQSFSIGRAGTTTAVSLVAIAPNPTPQFSDTASVSATVSPVPTATGNGVFSGSVSFSFDGTVVGSMPVSDASPTAHVDVNLDSLRIPSGAGGYAISATFTPGSPSNYATSTSGTGTGTVRKEGQGADDLADGSAQLSYGGDQFLLVGQAPNLVATLAQSLAPESGDSQFVDFSASDVYVAFDIYADGNPTAVWTSGNVKVADRTDWATNGTGFAQATGPASLPEGDYTITTRLITNGYILADDDTALLTVAAPTGPFISGGGFIAPDSTANTGKMKGQFGFDVKNDKKGLKGTATYRFKMRMDVPASTATSIVPCTTHSKTCRDVDVIVKSTKINALNTGTSVAYPMTGYATGQMSVQFKDGGKHLTQFEFTGGTFRLDIVDAGPGPAGKGGDMFGFTAYRKDGSVFHVANLGPIAQTGTGAMTNESTLGGGNVVVHPK